MAIPLTGADGLFTILGKAFFALDALDMGRLDVETQVDDYITAYKAKSDANLDMDNALQNIVDNLESWETTGDSLNQQLSANLSDLVIAFVEKDGTLPGQTITTAIQYLVDDIVAQDYYVDGNSIGLSLAADAGNSTNDLSIVYSEKADDSAVDNQFVLAEPITLTVDSENSSSAAVLAISGSEQARSAAAETWPMGSGVSATLTAANSLNSLIANGSFQDDTVGNDIPDSWIPENATPGTDLYVTAPEVQTLTIAGSPADGTWSFTLTNPYTGIVRSSGILEWDASSGDVQAALQGIQGFSSSTVATTGTTPNFAHAMTFTGVARDVALAVVENNLDTGTITPAQTTAGSDNAFQGKSLVFDSDGATLLAIYQILPTLTPEKTYVAHVRLTRTGAATTGTFNLECRTGLPGSAITTATTSVAATAIPTGSFTTLSMFFTIPKTTRQPAYIKLGFSVAPDAAVDIYVDEVVVTEATQLYTGGPYVAAFAGVVPPSNGDKWTLTATNDRAGQFQDHFERAFSMSSMGLQLPISGTTLIPDSLIA